MTRELKGISTRLMLLSALLLVIVSVTFSSLLVIRNRMQQQVLNDFAEDLAHSVQGFQSFQSQRLQALQRENALLADLPNLKALMTTSDERTIADGAIEFWKVGDNDLFALATNDGRIVAAYSPGNLPDSGLSANLANVLPPTNKHYLLSGDSLFEYNIRPLYFGGETAGTLLGYVVSGYTIDSGFLRQVDHSSSAEIAFLAGNTIVASTLQPSSQQALDGHPELFPQAVRVPATLSVGGQRYLAEVEDLTTDASAPLRLVVMKSFDHAERSQHEINRLLVLVGFFALLAGTMLMLAISHTVTRPLELLAKGVRAFGTGDCDSSLPRRGTREVRELSAAFVAMRDEIQQTNRASLETERLATIGRMASSVSHDLRHYLASMYASAEFLASSKLSDEERAELFADIRVAVLGTTELIDSLIIFSRAHGTESRTPELILSVLERAMALVRTHPDAEHVQLVAVHDDPVSTAAVVDSKQVERAIYNLLLNACQAVRGSNAKPTVTAVITSSRRTLNVTVTDQGPGVSDTIRDSMFEPFVSVGKQNGAGLGLTLAQCVAEEHGGAVRLVSSRPGETVFLLSIDRGGLGTLSNTNHLKSRR